MYRVEILFKGNWELAEGGCRLYYIEAVEWAKELNYEGNVTRIVLEKKS